MRRTGSARQIAAHDGQRGRLPRQPGTAHPARGPVPRPTATRTGRGCSSTRPGRPSTGHRAGDRRRRPVRRAGADGRLRALLQPGVRRPDHGQPRRLHRRRRRHRHHDRHRQGRHPDAGREPPAVEARLRAGRPGVARRPEHRRAPRHQRPRHRGRSSTPSCPSRWSGCGWWTARGTPTPWSPTTTCSGPPSAGSGPPA